MDTTPCSMPMRAYCFGVSNRAVVAMPAQPIGTRLAFVTPVTLGSGVAGLDASCQAAAQAAGATGTFKAWIATSTTAPTAPPPPWRRSDNVIAMTGDMQIVAPIDHTAAGTVSGFVAWTGSTQPTAMSPSAAASCDDWTNSSTALAGITGITARSVLPEAWDGSAEGCSGHDNVYCVEQ
jgi:hypothetical protein